MEDETNKLVCEHFSEMCRNLPLLFQLWCEQDVCSHDETAASDQCYVSGLGMNLPASGEINPLTTGADILHFSDLTDSAIKYLCWNLALEINIVESVLYFLFIFSVI